MTTLAHSFLIESSSFLQMIFILADDEDMHKSLDEFKFRPDTTTISRVICPCASDKLMSNVVNTLGPSFLIGSSSFLQVMGTIIKSWKRTKFDQILLWTAELAALERLENPHRLIMENLVNTLVPSFLIGYSSFLQVTRTCMKAWIRSNFGKFATELRPLIDVRIEFLLNILKTNRQIRNKFCIHIIIHKIYVCIVNHCFSQICKRVTALD